MPNSTPFGPFGLSQRGGYPIPLPTPPFIDQGPIPPAYMRAITNGDLTGSNITYMPFNINSDDDELLDPPAGTRRRPMSLDDIYRQSGLGNLFSRAQSGVDDAKRQFNDWLNSGPQTKGGAIARQGVRDAMAVGEKAKEFIPPGTPLTAADLYDNVKGTANGVIDWLNSPPAGGYNMKIGQPEAQAQEISGPSNSLPPGVSIEDALGMPAPGPNSLPPGKKLIDQLVETDPLGTLTDPSVRGLDDQDEETYPFYQGPPNTEDNGAFKTKADAAGDGVKKAAAAANKGSENWSDALIAFGGGMAASNARNSLQAAGQGALLGLKALQQGRDDTRKDRALDISASRANSAHLAAAAAVIKARDEGKPTKAKEFEYMKRLGWSDEDAAKGAKWLDDLDNDILKLVVSESVRAQAMGLGELKPEEFVKIIENAKKAKAMTSSSGQTPTSGGNVRRAVRDPATGALTFSN